MAKDKAKDKNLIAALTHQGATTDDYNSTTFMKRMKTIGFPIVLMAMIT